MVHPFSRLQQAWIGNNNNNNNNIDSLMLYGVISQVSLSVGSQASQNHPSGFWLHISSNQPLTMEELGQLTADWQQSRVVTTPLQGSVWDSEIVGQDDDTKRREYQLFVPLSGAAWSADALKQSFSILPCPNYLFGLSAMEWSRLLVEGSTTNKHTWVTWKTTTTTQELEEEEGPRIELRVGISFDSLVDVPPDLVRETSSCPLATRLLDVLPDSTPAASLEQVVRRPTPSEGRLETWFETTDSQASCSVRLRQRLPHYFEPQWRSLQVMSTPDTTGFDPAISVEWNDDDLSSVLTISHPVTPRSITISLDYDVAFLSLDDFPGDPNRGRELPPAVATLYCPQDAAPRSYFSNSVVIVPPVPDMSMPFNVLSLSCSLYAYLIGTIVTLLVKRSSAAVRYRLYPDQKPPSILRRLKAKLRAKFQRNGNGTTTSTTPTATTDGDPNDVGSEEDDGVQDHDAAEAENRLRPS
jgi:hypothetical protein